MDELRRKVGMCFSILTFFLLTCSILDNVTLAHPSQDDDTDERLRRRAVELLNRVGIGQRRTTIRCSSLRRAETRVAVADRWLCHQILCCLMSLHGFGSGDGREVLRL